MLVCSCNRIDHQSIEAEADRQIAVDPMRTPSPAQVYTALGERPRCCGCFPLAEKIIVSRKRSRTTCQAGAA